MPVRSTQDLATGLLFIAVGIAGLWLGADYPMGTTQRPEPACCGNPRLVPDRHRPPPSG